MEDTIYVLTKNNIPIQALDLHILTSEEMKTVDSRAAESGLKIMRISKAFMNNYKEFSKFLDDEDGFWR